MNYKKRYEPRVGDFVHTGVSYQEILRISPSGMAALDGGMVIPCGSIWPDPGATSDFDADLWVFIPTRQSLPRGDSMRDWEIEETGGGVIRVAFGECLLWLYPSGNHWEVEAWKGSKHLVTEEVETIQEAMAYAKGFYDQTTGN